MILQILWPAFALMAFFIAIIVIAYGAAYVEERDKVKAKELSTKFIICSILFLASAFVSIYGCRVGDYPKCPRYCDLPTTNQVSVER